MESGHFLDEDRWRAGHLLDEDRWRAGIFWIRIRGERAFFG